MGCGTRHQRRWIRREIGVVSPHWGQERDPKSQTRLAYGVCVASLTMLMMSIRVS